MSENVSSWHDPFQTPGGNLQDVAFDPAAQPQAGHDYEQSVGATLDLLLWQPAHGDLFKASDSALYGELQAEAAVILQRWYRSASGASCQDSGNHHDGAFGACGQCGNTLNSNDIDAACNKCEQPASSCICWSIHCRQCIPNAEECRCSRPLFRRRNCNSCGRKEHDDFSLFQEDGNKSFKPLPPFLCSSCGCNDHCNADYYLIQSGKTCSACRRIAVPPLQWWSASTPHRLHSPLVVLLD